MKLTLVFKGREMEHKQVGTELMEVRTRVPLSFHGGRNGRLRPALATYFGVG